jgi:4'-phosphopantetheinyl transferase EntD
VFSAANSLFRATSPHQQFAMVFSCSQMTIR